MDGFKLIKKENKMTNILTWYAPSNNGAFQKMSELGIFSDLLTVKPTFSFAFTSMNYIEQSNIFDIDDIAMTDAQKAEVLAIIEATIIPITWYKQVKQSQVSDAYQSAIQSIAGIVDSVEMISWTKQEAEARSYIADNTISTPFLSMMIISRGLGETVLQFANLIIAKADSYEKAYATILGTYQAKQKAISIATTVAELQAIT
jgi:hypothetical protein